MDRINTDEISSLIRTGQLEIKNTFIQIYESEEIRNAFSYRQHGFEYWPLEGSILDAVFQMARRSKERENRIFLRQAIVPLVVEWGRRQNFQFNVVVPVDTVYRDSNHKQNNNAFGPVCFAHIDFSTIDLIETFLHFKNTWKINIELALGRQPHTLTDEQYASIHVEKMINLWIPLSSCPTKNTLAVMDCSSFGQFNQEIQPYTAIRKSGDYFTALGLYSSRYHRWISQSDMKLGDAVVFDSLKTPHSAVLIDRPDALQEHRQSVEIRVLFLNVPADLHTFE